MKICLAIFYIVFSGHVWATESLNQYSDLNIVIKDLENFSLKIDKLLNTKNSDCHIDPSDNKMKNCQMTNYCQILNKNPETSFIRQLANGETILNERLYYLYNRDLKDCLVNNTFKEEIAQKLDEFKKLKSQTHLKEIYELNQKLFNNIKKNNELSNYAQINHELIALNLQDDIKNSQDGTIPIKSADVFREQLMSIQKKLKIKVSDKTLDLLVELNTKSQINNFDDEVKSFESSIYPKLKSPDIFYDSRNFSDATVAGSLNNLIKNQNNYNIHAQKVFNIFSEAKQRVITYLESQTTNTNKNQMKRAIERVKLVKFQTPTMNESLRLECSKSNTFYSPNNQSVTVCPQWFNAPSIYLLQTLSHEIAHSIDPCNLGFPLKIHNSTADIVIEGDFQTTLKMPLVKQSETLTDFPLEQNLRAQDQPAILLKENPFYNTIQCLQEKKSIGATTPSKELMAQNISNQIELMKKNKQNVDSNSQFTSLVYTQQHLDDYFDHYGACTHDFLGGISQLQEAFADKVASDVIAQKLKNMNKAKAQEEIENYALSEIAFDGNICEEGELTKNIKDKMQKLNCPNIYSNQSDSQKFNLGLSQLAAYRPNSHPATVDRMDKIFMANPEIRKILNCSENGVKYCEK